jgi:hypothetical protein
MSRSSAAWVFRAVAGALALLFLAVIQNGRANDARERDVDRYIAEHAPVFYKGQIAAGGTAEAGFIDDELLVFSLRLRFRCTPSVGEAVWASYDAAPTRDADGVASHRGPVKRVRLPHSWRGRSDLAYELRHDARRVTGTASARLQLDAGGRHATCTSVPARLDLPVSR